jgi:sugar lactone lactonase YvrE
MSSAAAATVLKVSLARPRERVDALPALAPAGARAILGTAHQDMAAPVQPAPHTLFGPRGAAVTRDGALWIADTGHHRLLGWPAIPQVDAAPASWLIGQRTFHLEGRNAKASVGPATLNVPTGVAACDGGLAVADAWNHRVLIWREAPRASHVPADIVLGQADAQGNAINRGRDAPAADTLYWPYGVFWDGARLWIADTGNRRVLGFDGMPQRDGQPADIVLGQPDFAHRDENAGAVGAGSLRWPHAITRWHGMLTVADAGNNRVLIWTDERPSGLAAAHIVIGQRDAHAVDHNRGEYWPRADSFNMPYGLAVHRDRLIVADTANSRLLRFDSPWAAGASALAGQIGFTDKGDNRWQPPARDSLCWPYAVAVDGDTCIVVDSGNNRVMLWDALP